MKFKELFSSLIAGVPIKRKPWGGYWKYDSRTGKILMYTKEGHIISLTNSEDILFTISGILEDDWEVATNENCVIPVY